LASKPTWDEKKKVAFFAEVYAIMRELLFQGKREEFIAALKRINAEWLPDIADESYHLSGGAHHLEDGVANLAPEFINGYADKFLDDLKASEDMQSFEVRAMMYPQEGFKLAVANGQRQAMRERGARKWRRVLGESKNGPCNACVADSKVTHDIDEPFFEYHPSGQCSQMFLHYTMSDNDSMELPVPSDRDTEYIRRRRI
jgi:hypothetical protein